MCGMTIIKDPAMLEVVPHHQEIFNKAVEDKPGVVTFVPYQYRTGVICVIKLIAKRSNRYSVLVCNPFDA